MNTRAHILKVATKLFSNKGYEGVSMRNIADEVKISAAALYNHFSDKESLYLTAISETFANKMEPLIVVANGTDEPIVRLKKFVQLQCNSINDNPDFHRLIQRELLDGDDKRQEYLVEEVFSPAFTCLKKLLTELKPDCDANSLFIMIIGMINQHFDLIPLMRFLPDYKSKHSDPLYIANQVMDVLSVYLGETK